MTKKIYLLFTISQGWGDRHLQLQGPKGRARDSVFLFQGVPWDNGTYGDSGKPCEELIKTALAVVTPLFPNWSPALRGT